MSRKIHGRTSSLRPLLLLCAILSAVFTETGPAQSVPYERTFLQSKAMVEKRIKELQMSAGRLPVLDGFTVPGDQPLNRFQRGYYQCSTQVISTQSGASLVRVRATVTAWYTDPVSGKSSYQVLPSNGRLENDFLDRLQEVLSDGALTDSANKTKSLMAQPKSSLGGANPTLSAPMPGNPTPIAKSTGSSTSAGSKFNLGDPLGAGHMASLATQKAIVDKHTEEQEREANALQEILSNQAHPSNLAAVTKAETPVLTSPNQGAKVLFLAAAEDEFEVLDSNPNWVHVRISGLSRGWIRRSSLEMPDRETESGPAKHDEEKAPKQPAVVDQKSFEVQSEQIASFPGTWAPLRGKTVSIISVQKTADSSTDTGSSAKLVFAKSLFDKAYGDLAKGSTSIDGIVIIFDSEDGGMTAATVAVLRQWKTGALSEEGFWRRCFFDPPEAFNSISHP
jgi:hypothetical protein